MADSDSEKSDGRLDALLGQLNERQREVVLHRGPPLLVLAAAGTGKTQSLTCRIASFLVEGVKPEQILALTFTNKAAREMRERASRLGGVPPEQMCIGTFHSVCARLLRAHAVHLPQVGLGELDAGFHIMDNTEALKLLKDCMFRMGYKETGHVRVVDVYSIINAWRNMGLDVDAVLSGAQPPAGCRSARIAVDAARTLYRCFRQACLSRNAVDFGDLIMYSLRLLKACDQVRAECRSQWTHVLVDEFQDTNDAQLQLLKLLVDPLRTDFMVVGDDCQAIHGWRGAVVAHILQFERHFPQARVMVLEENYRSVEAILDAANRLIGHNPHQRPKVLRATRSTTDQKQAAVISVTSHDTTEAEAAAIAAEIVVAHAEGSRRPGDFAVLYRINAQSLPLEEALRAAGVPYTLRGAMSFYARAEVKDVLAYVRLLYQPDDCDADFKRVANTPPRGVGPKLLQDVVDRAVKRGEGCIAAARAFVAAADSEAERKKKRAAAPAAVAAGNKTATTAGAARRYAGLRTLLATLDALRTQPAVSLVDATSQLLEKTGYLRWLALQPDGMDRIENVNQLLTSMVGLTYSDVLDRVFDDDDPGEAATGGAGSVSLMTLHASKGLEFPCVFIVGFDNTMLPFHKAVTEGRLDEERRLAYVGVTRARDKLRITYPLLRQAYGGAVQTRQSQFIAELMV